MRTSPRVEHRQAELEAFLAQWFGDSEPAAPERPARPTPGPAPNYSAGSLTDDEILVKATKAANGAKFKRLFDGDWSAYQSQSEADQALCNLLAFWTGCDADQIDRLFCLSGLADRDKAKRADYRARTVAKAITGCQETYSSGADRGHESTGGGAADFREQRREQGHQEQAEPEEWQAPIPLDRPDLPTFDAGDFPFTLWAMIEGIARATETPPELAGMNVLAVAAAAVQRKLTIELDRGYIESLPLWTATQLPPGSRKSAAQKPATRPLLQWEIEQAQALTPVMKAAKATRAAEELRLRELQRKFSKAEDESKREALREEIEKAEAGLTEIPRPPRIIGQDITPEHLSCARDHRHRQEAA